MRVHDGKACVGKLTIHYSELGTGVPILFIHGLGGCRHMFVHYVFPWLNDAGRLIAFDLPGYDDTPPLGSRNTIQAYSELLPGLLDALEITRCHLVGVSMGGTIAIRVAAHHAQRIISVCASGPIIHGAANVPTLLRMPLTAFLRPITFLPHGPLQRLNAALFAKRIVVRWMGKLVNPVDLILLGESYPDIATHAVSKSSVRVWAENLISIVNADFRTELADLSVPVLLVDGELVYFKFARFVKESAYYIPPDVRNVATIPVAGHLAPFTNPESFAATLRKFHLQHDDM